MPTTKKKKKEKLITAGLYRELVEKLRKELRSKKTIGRCKTTLYMNRQNPHVGASLNVEYSLGAYLKNVNADAIITRYEHQGHIYQSGGISV